MPSAAGGQNQPDHERRQRFDPAMAVGMSGVGGRAGHHHPGKDNQRREDIAGELDAGGDDRRGLDGQTNGDVERREDGAGAHPDEREAAAGLEVCALAWASSMTSRPYKKTRRRVWLCQTRRRGV